MQSLTLSSVAIRVLFGRGSEVKPQRTGCWLKFLLTGVFLSLKTLQSAAITYFSCSVSFINACSVFISMLNLGTGRDGELVSMFVSSEVELPVVSPLFASKISKIILENE